MIPINTPPEGYRVSSYCRSCGKDFPHDGLFDRHRTGSFAAPVSAEFPVGRRCKSDEELIESGIRMMTEEEMSNMKRHKHRVGYGVQMWFDPDELDRARASFATST